VLRRVTTVNITYRTDAEETETVSLQVRRVLPPSPLAASAEGS